MTLEYLDWDSRFFTLAISRLDVDSELPDRNRIDPGANDLVYVFSTVRQPHLEQQGVLLADTRITYEKTIRPASGHASGSEHDPAIESYEGPALPVLLDLGIASGWTSRFQVDPKLRHKHAALYREWVINSISRTIADEVLVIGVAGGIAGLVTLKQHGHTGKIGIIAIDAQHRGQALGARLLQACDRWYAGHGVTHAEVVTQQANAGACRFYEKNGYTIKATEYVYHLWS